jgi:hypothetical protein
VHRRKVLTLPAALGVAHEHELRDKARRAKDLVEQQAQVVHARVANGHEHDAVVAQERTYAGERGAHEHAPLVLACAVVVRPRIAPAARVARAVRRVEVRDVHPARQTWLQRAHDGHIVAVHDGARRRRVRRKGDGLLYRRRRLWIPVRPNVLKTDRVHLPVVHLPRDGIGTRSQQRSAAVA